jgi:hypothetical protein
MTLPNGSASSIERTIACPAWLCFPRVEREDEWAAQGHELHNFSRAALGGADVEREIGKLSERARPFAVRLDWGALIGDVKDVRCEVAYAIDVRKRTVRELGVGIERRYEEAAKKLGKPLGAWEVPGSNDLEGVRLEDASKPVTIDLKTGYKDITAGDDNGQARFYGAVSVLQGHDEAEVRMVAWRATGKLYADRTVFTPLDVDTFLDELEEALKKSKAMRKAYAWGRMPDVTEGPWCEHCPAKHYCPAKTQLVRSALPYLEDMRGRVEALTLAELGEAWEIANDRIKPLLELVLEPIKERIKAERLVPLKTPGKVARVIEYPRDFLDQAAALELLRTLGASESQIGELYLTKEIVQVRTTNAPKASAARAR